MTKQWTNPNGLTFHFDDDKLNFDEWVSESEERVARWSAGVDQHRDWAEKNPDKSDFENENSVCGKMTEEWMGYANALSDEHYTP